MSSIPCLTFSWKRVVLPLLVSPGLFGGLPLPASDCNKNGIEDNVDIEQGQSLDCNSDGVPDECELVEKDCNRNGAPDDCDIATGASLDCNQNGIPDECDVSPRMVFPAATTYTVGGSPFNMRAADLDRDGDMDLVVANRGSGDVSILINTGRGNFVTGRKLPVGTSPHPLIIVDINGDQDPDIIVGNRGSDDISVLL